MVLVVGGRLAAIAFVFLFSLYSPLVGYENTPLLVTSLISLS